MTKKASSVIFLGGFTLWLIGLIASHFVLAQKIGSSSSILDLLPHSDKLLHTGYYFIGSFFLLATMYVKANSSQLTAKIWFVNWIIMLSIAVLDEYVQSFVATRKGNDFGDLLADIIGIIMASILLKHYRKRKINDNK